MMKKLLCSLLFMALSVSLYAAKKPKALLIMLDGMRNDAYITQGFSPMIDGNKILGDDYKTAVGLYTETVLGAPANSAPNHSGLATGVFPKKNGVYNNGQTKKGKFDQYPHILSYLADQYKTAFLYGWRESGDIRSSSKKVEYLNVGDKAVEKEAIKRLQGDIDAMYVYIDAPDHAGHGYGFYPNAPQYRQVKVFAKNIILNLLKTIRNRPTFSDEDWMIFVTSDHGGYHRDHGMASHHARISIMSVLSRHLDRGFLADNHNLVDLPATILNHFGIDGKKHGLDGQVIQNHVIPFSKGLPENLNFVKYRRQGNALPFTVNADLYNGFTIFLQVKAGKTQKGDPPLFGNKDWSWGFNPGIVLAANVRRDGTGPGYVFNVGLKGKEKNKRVDLGILDPAPGKEVGLMVSVFPNDKCFLMEYRGKDEVYLLTDLVPGSLLDTNMKLHFGEDGTANYSKKFKSTFNGTISNVKVLEQPLYPDDMLEFCNRYFQAK